MNTHTCVHSTQQPLSYPHTHNHPLKQQVLQGATTTTSPAGQLAPLKLSNFPLRQGAKQPEVAWHFLAPAKSGEKEPVEPDDLSICWYLNGWNTRLLFIYSQ